MTQPQSIPALQPQLDARLAKSKVPAEKRTIMQQFNRDLAASGILDHVLQVGDIAPDFTLPDVHGHSVTLSEKVAEGPVVLTFYRGGWCPYCNVTLAAYQAHLLPELQTRNVPLIAVSPQTPDESLSTAEKHALAFTVLSDEGNAIAREYKLVFRFNDDLIRVYNDLKLDVVRANGNEDWELPLPGTYVIDSERKIRFAFADTNYVKRAEPADILAALDQM